MSLDASGSDSDRRWAEANALLRGSPDQAVLQKVRGLRRRMWLIVGAVTLSFVVIGVLAVFLISRGDDDTSDATSSSSPLWLSTVGVICSAVGLLIIVAYVIKARQAGWFSLGPLSVLSRSQRRGLRRQVLGKESPQPAHLPLLRHLAGRMAHQRSFTFLMPIGLLLSQFGSLLTSPSIWKAVFLAVLALLFLPVVVQVRRETRRAERFLAEYPEQPKDAAGLG